MQRRSSSKGGSAPVALALALASSAAHGQPQPQPGGIDALLHEGVELRRGHRDLEALAVFRRAYDRSRGPRALAQMALAEQALGRWVEAETHLLAALAAPDPWIARSRATLEAALAVIGQHLGGLWIDGTVSGTEIYVEGQRVATLPMVEATRVIAGSVSVEVRAPGYESVTRRVTVPAGGEAREVVRLNRAATDPAPSRVAPATTTPRATGTAARPGGTARMLAWVSLGGAVAGVTVGVVALVVREGAVTEYNQDPACPGQRSSDQRGDCATRISTANAMYFVEPIAFVAGAALAVTSVVLFATAPVGERDREHVARFACGVGLAMPGVTCGGRF